MDIETCLPLDLTVDIKSHLSSFELDEIGEFQGQPKGQGGQPGQGTKAS